MAGVSGGSAVLQATREIRGEPDDSQVPSTDNPQPLPPPLPLIHSSLLRRPPLLSLLASLLQEQGKQGVGVWGDWSIRVVGWSGACSASSFGQAVGGGVWTCIDGRMLLSILLFQTANCTASWIRWIRSCLAERTRTRGPRSVMCRQGMGLGIPFAIPDEREAAYRSPINQPTEIHSSSAGGSSAPLRIAFAHRVVCVLPALSEGAAQVKRSAS